MVSLAGRAPVLVAVVGGAYLAYRIITPVKALSEASLRLANGDYSQRIPVTSEDELGEMSKSFNKMAMELEHQENLRRRAMADIAHELRTPLSVLQIDLESIEDGLVEPTDEAIQRLQKEVELMSKLVDDLRLLSSAEAGELRLDFHTLDLAGLVQAVVKRFEATAREQRVDMIFNEPGEELWISGDEQRLVQVLLNLLTNAVNHTPPEGQLVVKAEEAEELVRVSIADTGVGISQEDLPHVFERLYRADKARSREKGGSGLGLSIAKSIIDAHGGSIRAESEEGQGSIFTFELPYVPGEIEDPGPVPG
ncbi:MAG: ATP-binding protein [Anaerolineaceae bacterium]|nr:ATP-binding protein [Anaerolineaceae bacterium]